MRGGSEQKTAAAKIIDFTQPRRRQMRQTPARIVRCIHRCIDDSCPFHQPLPAEFHNERPNQDDARKRLVEIIRDHKLHGNPPNSNFVDVV